MAAAKLGADKYKTLADHQQRRWDLQHRTGESSTPAPCVAISRLPGAGGEEIGQRVAELLDYGFFGREIVEEIAQELHVDSWVVAGLDERVRGSIERFLTDLVRAGHHVTEKEYLREVIRIVVTLGRRGSTVIVGRGAPHVLSAQDSLRILVVAPQPQRVERYAKIKGLAADRAKEALALEEGHRSEFVRRQFGARLDDPSCYDLTVNTSTVSYEDAASLIVEALRRRFPG